MTIEFRQRLYQTILNEKNGDINAAMIVTGKAYRGLWRLVYYHKLDSETTLPENSGYDRELIDPETIDQWIRQPNQIFDLLASTTYRMHSLGPITLKYITDTLAQMAQDQNR